MRKQRQLKLCDLRKLRRQKKHWVRLHSTLLKLFFASQPLRAWFCARTTADPSDGKPLPL
jgi:hypothetical protein